MISFLLVAATASTGVRFRPDKWYVELNKPAWNPPNWLFPVAWSILYVMMAVAAWRIFLAEPMIIKWLALIFYL
ncbi:MAG TPA: tryptophan-rich sensory protein, partial [Halothiobacillaceae bacterium]|nr:tryptophan-rich sensory protein [Halothiobacillaceae bacterium]